MKWREYLINADLDMAQHARKYGQAKIEITYYGEKGGIVRKRLTKMPEEMELFYDNGIDED